MSSHNKKTKVGISHGDINGISYEVVLKTLQDNRIIEFCTPILYGSPKVSAYHRKALNITSINLTTIKQTEEANPKRVNILNCIDDNVRVELGKSTTMAGESSFKALETAVNDLIENKIDVLVTAPINKKNIQSKDFKFPGHTEYLKEKFEAEEVLMIMISDIMKIGIVTGHIPVKDIAATLNSDLILSKLRMFNESLKVDFAIRKPRIAVLGLNPHNSDDGLIGDEEEKIIIPAVEAARNENIIAIGPFPPDGFFGSENFMKFDGILAMYHDQGLIPFKALTFDSGVNYTAGLPVVRTSPDHGTAYEIAGQNVASPNSFRNALYLALDIYKNRNLYKELTSNQLEKAKIDEKNNQ
ncbi:MAG: 4-hydroxythreonine-4-phosphate dehydrogenase PdxA [Chlorobi bacterium]|nr:4-hydroxythreonine-4-phosphate dehydrogenase PdxA [Chlorobiota bacterium]